MEYRQVSGKQNEIKKKKKNTGAHTQTNTRTTAAYATRTFYLYNAMMIFFPELFSGDGTGRCPKFSHGISTNSSCCSNSIYSEMIYSTGGSFRRNQINSTFTKWTCNDDCCNRLSLKYLTRIGTYSIGCN